MSHSVKNPATALPQLSSARSESASARAEIASRHEPERPGQRLEFTPSRLPPQHPLPLLQIGSDLARHHVQVRARKRRPVHPWRPLGDLVAKLLQHRHGFRHRSGAIGVNRPAQNRLVRPRDPQTARILLRLAHKWPRRRRDPVRRARLRSVRRVEHGGTVAHRPGQHMLDDGPVPWLPAQGSSGNAATGGFEPEEPAARRRDADRPRPVPTAGDRHDSRRHRGR